MNDVLIRPATSADVVALAHLMAELGYPGSAEDMATRLQAIEGRTDYAAAVAVADGGLAGMVGMMVTPSLYADAPDGAISALVVSSDFRGRGIGGLLVAHAEQWLVQAGAKRASIKPSLHREDAHRLYRRCGYQHTGMRFTKEL
jgi:GNAT superfamily N-acetyltransferase